MSVIKISSFYLKNRLTVYDRLMLFPLQKKSQQLEKIFLLSFSNLPLSSEKIPVEKNMMCPSFPRLKWTRPCWITIALVTFICVVLLRIRHNKRLTKGRRLSSSEGLLSHFTAETSRGYTGNKNTISSLGESLSEWCYCCTITMFWSKDCADNAKQ